MVEKFYLENFSLVVFSILCLQCQRHSRRQPIIKDIFISLLYEAFFVFFFDIQYSLSKQHSKRPLENLIVIKRRLEFLVIVKLVTIVVKRDYPLWN